MEQIPYLSLVRPKGTFYLFPGIEKTGLSAEDFCQALLERAHVLVTPGTLFGSTGAGHFRIACTVGLDRLKEAFDRMERPVLLTRQLLFSMFVNTLHKYSFSKLTSDYIQFAY